MTSPLIEMVLNGRTSRAGIARRSDRPEGRDPAGGGDVRAAGDHGFRARDVRPAAARPSFGMTRRLPFNAGDFSTVPVGAVDREAVTGREVGGPAPGARRRATAATPSPARRPGTPGRPRACRPSPPPATARTGRTFPCRRTPTSGAATGLAAREFEATWSDSRSGPSPGHQAWGRRVRRRTRRPLAHFFDELSKTRRPAGQAGPSDGRRQGGGRGRR